MKATITVTFDLAAVDESYYSEPIDMTLAAWRKDWAEGVVDDMCRADTRASYEVVYELPGGRPGEGTPP